MEQEKANGSAAAEAAASPGDLRARAREALAAGGMTQARAAREIGVSAAALSQWLAGSYAGDSAAVDGKVRRWLDSLARGEALERELPAGPDWVDTPSASRVEAALSYAQLAGFLAVVHGAAGTGKTVACERYARQNPNVWLATMSGGAITPHACLRRVAAACGGRAREAKGAADLEDAIAARLRGTRGLLVVDEAQHLGVRALEALRYLHDATGIGVALVGGELLYERLTGGDRSSRYAQLFSRIGKRVHLPAPEAADAGALLAGWGVEGAAARREARRIAALPGGLRGLSHALRLASVFAAGEAVTAEHLRAAWADSGGAA